MKDKVRALRGATTVAEDVGESVIEETAALLREMMERNGVDKDDLISVVFTATEDIRSEFPAAAARKVGISDIPLLCTRELDITGATPRVIRVMMHIYTDRDYDSLRHVYLGEARALRTDLRQ